MSSVDDLLFSLIMLINKVTCEVFTLSVSLFLMTGRHFRITDAFTDVIGAAGGHRGRFTPVALLVPSLWRLNSASRSSRSRSSSG